MGIPISEEAETVKIFGWWQFASKLTEPYFHCTPTEAVHLIAIGAARKCLKGFSIQLIQPPEPRRRTIDPVVVRGCSCQMGPRVSIGFAAGVPYYASIVEGWRPPGVKA